MLDRFLEQYRRFYWAANGILVLGIAYVLAGLVTRTAIDRFVPMPEPAPRAAPVAVKNNQPASFADYQVILSRNLLNAKVEEAPKPVVESNEPAKTTIQATLVGTVAGPDRFAFCIVQVAGKTEVVRLHEKIGNQAEVLEIRRGVITIMNNGRKEELSMYEEKALPGNTPPPEVAPEPIANALAMDNPINPDGQPDVDVTESSPGNYVIDKGAFESMTSNLGPLLTQARVVPNFAGGVINGYKIFAIKPESLYMKIGLENGDVIRSINGVKVDSPEKALQLLQSLKTERSFSIDLSRNNEPVSFNYNLR